jgi:hypothetical protein
VDFPAMFDYPRVFSLISTPAEGPRAQKAGGFKALHDMSSVQNACWFMIITIYHNPLWEMPMHQAV